MIFYFSITPHHKICEDLFGKMLTKIPRSVFCFRNVLASLNTEKQVPVMQIPPRHRSLGKDVWLGRCPLCERRSRWLSVPGHSCAENNMRGWFCAWIRKTPFQAFASFSQAGQSSSPGKLRSVFCRTWVQAAPSEFAQAQREAPSAGSASPAHTALEAAGLGRFSAPPQSAGAISLLRHWSDSAKGTGGFKTAPRNQINSLSGLKKKPRSHS